MSESKNSVNWSKTATIVGAILVIVNIVTILVVTPINSRLKSFEQYQMQNMQQHSKFTNDIDLLKDKTSNNNTQIQVLKERVQQHQFQ